MLGEKLLQIIRYLFGSADTFKLEHRILNALLISSLIAAFLASTINLVLDLDVSLTYTTITGAFLIMILYYLSRVRKVYSFTLAIYLILIFVILSMTWFFNAGIDGPVLLLYVSLFALLIAASKGFLRTFIILGFLTNIAILINLEILYPEYIIEYEDPDLKYYDVYFTLLFACLLTVAFITYIMKSYNLERERALMQRDKIEKQKKEITSSIQYAEYIQSALLPSRATIRNSVNDFFIYYKPRDIVGGDFYWVTKINDLSIFAVADCTGHGVPGGFMSMLGIALLNEIVIKNGITKADEILNKLRDHLIESFKQKDESEQRDGMDIAIITYNEKSRKVSYAGALSPVFIVSEKLRENTSFNNVIDNESFYLEELKPDLMPISMFHKMEEFSIKEFDYQQGDILYMFTDGFADQYGGEDRKKFCRRNFKRYLLSIAHKSLPEQKILIEKTFNTWTGENRQIDDVLVMGIQLTKKPK